MSTAAMPGVGRIGPNAIVQVAHALRAQGGETAVRRLFRRAGLARYLQQLPSQMVDEAEVVRLHHALLRELPPDEAVRISREAGRRTGDYLLAHRIPAAVQWLLKGLPAAWAARVLMKAIRRHAWTFAGSGRFSAEARGPAEWVLQLEANPMCRQLPRLEAPACHYYAATFERLFVALVHPAASVVETACEACGDDACRFELRWPARRALRA